MYCFACESEMKKPFCEICLKCFRKLKRPVTVVSSGKHAANIVVFPVVCGHVAQRHRPKDYGVLILDAKQRPVEVGGPFTYSGAMREARKIRAQINKALKGRRDGRK